MKLRRTLLLCLALSTMAITAQAYADTTDQWAAKARQLLEEGSSYSALREGERVFHESEARGDELGLASGYCIVGEVSLSQRNYEQAADNFRQALLILTTKFKNEKARTSYTYYNYTRALGKLTDNAAKKQAIDGWEKYLEEWKAELKADRQPTESLNEDYIRLKLAKADYLIATDQPEAALALMQEAEAMKTAKTKAFDRQMAEHYTKYYKATGNLTKALEANKQCRQYDIEKNDSAAMIDDLETEASLLMMSGRKREAAVVFGQLNRDKDALTRSETSRMLKEMYQYYQVDERIAEENQKAERTRALMLNLLILSLCIVALALVFAALSRRKMVNRLRKSTDELAAANQSLEQANKQALLSAEMKESFIRHVSHEVRTPLNIISGFTQVLSTPNLNTRPEERQRMVEQIDAATKNITNIMRNLKELADMEKIDEIDHSISVGCNALCETAAQQSGVKENIDFRFSIDSHFPEDLVIETNDKAVVDILRELIANAQKFTKKGTITLSCGQDTPSKVWFAVTDDGERIPRQEAERIFEVFVKLNDFDIGIGGGLAVCRSLAQRLGGRLWLDTDYKEGNRFILELNI